MNYKKKLNGSSWLKNILRVVLIVLLNMGFGQNTIKSQDTNSLNLHNIKDNDTQQPQNVIFILSDDHRYDDLGFMGHPFLETPNMDWMADNGFHFSNANVTTSLCSPSRASILTGMYAHKHKAVNNQFRLQEGSVFFPQYLQKAGYQTAFIGKWHMGASTAEPRPGFDHWISFGGQGYYYNPTLNENGKTVEYTDGTYITDLLTQKAITFLDERSNEQPFFLYLSHKAVHGMWRPARRHEDRYENDTPAGYLPNNYTGSKTLSRQVNSENREGLPMWVKNQRNSWHGAEFPLHNADKNIVQKYYEDMAETLLGIDESLGQVINYLKKNDLMENTMIIYMSDNGFQYGDHGLFDKRVAYEASIRVPLLVYKPELADRGGTQIDQLVANIDIAPTILAAAGLKAPPNMDGRNFLPLMNGQTNDWRDYMLYEYYWEYNFPQTPTQFALKGQKYKYINYYGIWDTNELYDLQKDPEEYNNLIQDPDYKDIVVKMKDRLFNILQKTGGMYIPLYPDKGRQRNLRNKNKSEAADFPSFMLVDPTGKK